jgi:hypothetical protein
LELATDRANLEGGMCLKTNNILQIIYLNGGGGGHLIVCPTAQCFTIIIQTLYDISQINTPEMLDVI